MLLVYEVKLHSDIDQVWQRIKNHSGSNGNEQSFNDRYYRETFFASVHTRNLAKPIAISETTGESIGQTTSYNK